MSKRKKYKLPYMPFFIGDWFKCPEVRALPLDTRMVWFEMMCIMWECEERGILTMNRKPIPPDNLSRILGITPQHLSAHLQILWEFNLYSTRDFDGAIYCRRIVEEEIERRKHQKAGKKGGNPVLIRKVNQEDKTSSYPRSDSDSEYNILEKEESVREEKDSQNPFDFLESKSENTGNLKSDSSPNSCPPKKAKSKPKSDKHRFEDSPYFDPDKLKTALGDWSSEEVEHWWDILSSASESNSDLKYSNWAAVARSWKLRDERKGVRR